MSKHLCCGGWSGAGGPWSGHRTWCARRAEPDPADVERARRADAVTVGEDGVARLRAPAAATAARRPIRVISRSVRPEVDIGGDEPADAGLTLEEATAALRGERTKDCAATGTKADVKVEDDGQRVQGWIVDCPIHGGHWLTEAMVAPYRHARPPAVTPPAPPPPLVHLLAHDGSSYCGGARGNYALTRERSAATCPRCLTEADEADVRLAEAASRGGWVPKVGEWVTWAAHIDAAPRVYGRGPFRVAAVLDDGVTLEKGAADRCPDWSVAPKALRPSDPPTPKTPPAPAPRTLDDDALRLLRDPLAAKDHAPGCKVALSKAQQNREVAVSIGGREYGPRKVVATCVCGVEVRAFGEGELLIDAVNGAARVGVTR